MTSVLWIALLLAVFVACRRSGRVFERHYGDRAELGAVVLVGLCVLLPLALGASATTVRGVPLTIPLGLAVAAGLLGGTREPAR